MILGIMQPYFFPYWGHFALIAAVDRWVVFDITQYTPKSWMNRNRILHPTQGWQYVTVPLDKASMSIRTCEARVLNPAAAGAQIVRQLMHYRKRAPYFAAVIDLVERVFANLPDESLVTLNTAALAETCAYLGVSFNYEICSRLALDLPQTMGPGDWAPAIASRLGARGYVNPAGGRTLFDPQAFAALDIELAFLETGNFVYPTPGYAFEPNLSILDAMMWNDAETIRRALLSLARATKATTTLKRD
ncbi:MAG TPA: WbqC family protein [Noviherbaspirillum sp.]|nr:WbqC family protein [Noviherbaspirillum sp.]